MFIDRLLNIGNAPVIEASVRFAAARHRLLAQDIANVDTPGYIQHDLSTEKFQQALARRLEEHSSGREAAQSFDDLQIADDDPKSGILFHDQNNRSMEQLMSDSAKNALFHNMMVEMLRKQFDTMELALKDRL